MGEASRPLNSLNVPLPPSPVCISPPPVEKKRISKKMAETKSTSRAGSKLNLNESTMPLLDEEAHEKAETPEKDAIEMKEKASTTSEGEKDDSNPEKTEGEEEEEEKKDDGEEKKSKKSKKEKKEKTETAHRRTQSCVQTFTVGLNVLDRDEKHINDTINLNFEDVLAEPDASHGFDPIWRSAFILFTGSRYWIYRLLSALFALPLALVWGVLFSLITFVSVWLATPVLRILDVVLFYIRRVLVALVQTTLEPVANAFGGCFHKKESTPAALQSV